MAAASSTSAGRRRRGVHGPHVPLRRQRQRERVLQIDSVTALRQLVNEVLVILAKRLFTHAGDLGRLTYQDLLVPLARRQIGDVSVRIRKVLGAHTCV